MTPASISFYASQFNFLKIYFNWRLITILWFLPHIDMNQPWVDMCPPPQLRFHFSPHPIPLGYPRAPALCVLIHALNLHWSFVLHMVIYMFQCYSLRSSHPRPLPQSPKDRSIPLCLLLSRI